MKHLKTKIQNWLLRHLFNAVTEEDFLQVIFTNNKPVGIIIGSERLEGKKCSEYQKQAKAILSLPLWELVTKSMKHTANENLFKKAATVDDMMYAKAMLYTIDVIEKKFENLSNITN